VALSLSLVVPATTALRSASHLAELDLGFRAEGVWTGSLLLRANSYPNGEAMVHFYERVVASVSEIPGVESAGLARQAAYSDRRDPIRVEGEGDAVGSLAILMEVDGGWFATLDVPVRSGRAFTRQDRSGTSPVAIVSSRLAERLWPDADPIGRRLRLDDGSTIQEGSDGVVWRRVVGVAEDMRPTLTDGETPVIYLPLAQSPGVHANLIVRVTEETAAVRPELRAAVGDADPSVALSGIGRLEDTVAQVGRPTRFLASFLAGFAAFALLVAVLGLYAVLSFISIQRRRDLAIRMALGAERSTVTGRFVTQSLVLIGLGLAIGLVGAATLEGYVVAQLQGVTRLDPLTYGAAIALMVLSGLLASWIPARRATGSDPMSVLRQE
jgi:predicted permease